MISKAYLLLGSNQGNKLAILKNAAEKLQELSESPIQLSSFFESEPWGFEADEWFVNLAIIIETKRSPSELLSAVLDIEKELGRVRPYNTKQEKAEYGQSYTSRTLDIDILLYENEIIDTGTLQIPHPKMHLRKFVLLPLFEIAPQEIHSVFKKTIKNLLQECEDKLIVRKI